MGLRKKAVGAPSEESKTQKLLSANLVYLACHGHRFSLWGVCLCFCGWLFFVWGGCLCCCCVLVCFVYLQDHSIVNSWTTAKMVGPWFNHFTSISSTFRPQMVSTSFLYKISSNHPYLLSWTTAILEGPRFEDHSITTIHFPSFLPMHIFSKTFFWSIAALIVTIVAVFVNAQTGTRSWSWGLQIRWRSKLNPIWKMPILYATSARDLSCH